MRVNIITGIFLFGMLCFSNSLFLRKEKCIREGANCLGTTAPCCDGMECIYEGSDLSQSLYNNRCGYPSKAPSNNLPTECVNKGKPLPGHYCKVNSDCCYNICDTETNRCDWCISRAEGENANLKILNL